jgi:hypothetical protein
MLVVVQPAMMCSCTSLVCLLDSCFWNSIAAWVADDLSVAHVAELLLVACMQVTELLAAQECALTFLQRINVTLTRNWRNQQSGHCI